MTLPTKQKQQQRPFGPLKTLSTRGVPGIWILEWGYSDIFETASKACETRRIPVTIPIRGVAEHTQQQPAVCEMLEYMYRGVHAALLGVFSHLYTARNAFSRPRCMPHCALESDGVLKTCRSHRHGLSLALKHFAASAAYNPRAVSAKPYSGLHLKRHQQVI